MNTAELRAFDAGYVPFRGVEVWVDRYLDNQTWDRYCVRLTEARLDTPSEGNDGEVVKSLLAAAVNTARSKVFTIQIAG